MPANRPGRALVAVLETSPKFENHQEIRPTKKVLSFEPGNNVFLKTFHSNKLCPSNKTPQIPQTKASEAHSWFISAVVNMILAQPPVLGEPR